MGQPGEIELRRQNTVDRRQNEKQKNRTDHESTKFGKHEKGPGFLYNPFFFRVFVPSCFRGELLGFILTTVYCILVFILPHPPEWGSKPSLNHLVTFLQAGSVKDSCAHPPSQAS